MSKAIQYVHIADRNGFTLYHSNHEVILKPFDPSRCPINPLPMATKIYPRKKMSQNAIEHIVGVVSVLTIMLLVSLTW